MAPRLSFSMAATACLRASSAFFGSAPAAATSRSMRLVTLSNEMSTFSSESADFSSMSRVPA